MLLGTAVVLSVVGPSLTRQSSPNATQPAFETASVRPNISGSTDRGGTRLHPAAGPSIFIAVRDQLGLKLEAQTASVPIVVIDHAERPVPD
ncbi:MAG: TIGR03435 family protein [Acidobacteria bacterium]|nr:TIGR03435 family protein [Acidobacteriota bacterium]